MINLADDLSSNTTADARFQDALDELLGPIEVDDDQILSVDLIPPASDVGGQTALAGRLEEMNVERILQLATSVTSPSYARLERDGVALELFFIGGSPAMARRDGMPKAAQSVMREALRWRRGTFAVRSRVQIPTNS